MSMDCSRRKLFATAGRTDNEDAAIRRRHLLDGLPQLINRRGMSNQRRGQRCELLELLHLALKTRILECTLGDQQQAIGLERLFDEIVGTALNGRYRSFD